jgi:hypothetical protein
MSLLSILLRSRQTYNFLGIIKFYNCFYKFIKKILEDQDCQNQARTYISLSALLVIWKVFPGQIKLNL